MGRKSPSAYDPTVLALREGSAERRCSSCGGTFPEDFVVCPRDATPLVDEGKLAEDRLVGMIVGGTYRILKVLAEGGMGRLYEAEHVRLECHLAVKVIHEQLSQVSDLLVRFEREARAASRIRSEHIVRVVDVLRTPDARPCIVTDLLQGEDLQAYLDRTGPMTAEGAIPIVRQICRGLVDAHGCGIVHRDLKPSNVFLSQAAGGIFSVKILDFGVAKMMGDPELTRTGAVVGTPAYMAPEQARHSGEADHRADIYAVGAIFYRMLTGKPPYGGNDQSNPLITLLQEDPVRPRSLESSISAGIEAVIQHAMARDPASRPQSAVELEIELAAFDHGSSAAPSYYAAPSADTITRRARTARPIAAVLTILSFIVATFYLAGLFTATFVAFTAPPLSPMAQRVITWGAVLAGFFLASVQFRSLTRGWRSTQSVSELNRLVCVTLIVGVGTLGALELLTQAGTLWKLEFADAARGVSLRLVLAGLASAMAFARQRRIAP